MCSRSKLCGRSCLMTRSVLSILLYRLYMQRVRGSTYVDFMAPGHSQCGVVSRAIEPELQTYIQSV